MDNQLQGVSRRGFALLGAGLAAVGATGLSTAARAAANPVTGGDWMAQVKAQHAEIDRLFGQVRSAKTTPARAGALKQLGSTLTGHSIAEEVVLYPHIAIEGDEAGSTKAHAEQQQAKVLMARLDAMPDKTTTEFNATFETLVSAIKAHVAEEEGQLYPALMKKATRQENAKMTEAFRREYTRYVA